MRCEVCGSKIHGSPIRAEISGAKLTVCIDCSKYGRIIKEEKAELGQKAFGKPFTPIKFKRKERTGQAKVEITQEIVEGYHYKIRQAREKLGLSHEELGKRIKEKSSVLSKLETGKMTPDNKLIAKLEHFLRISLLAPIEEEKISPALPLSTSRERTLGELIKLNKKGWEEPTERKQ